MHTDNITDIISNNNTIKIKFSQEVYTMSKKENLRDKVFRGVKEEIIKGNYSPNDIINEGALIEKYGVSKSPVRDALIELCNDGTLINIPRLGYRVVDYSKDYYDKIVDFRLLVEANMLEKYWDRLTSDDIDELEALHVEQTNLENRDSMEIYWKSNQEFHLKLASFYHDEFFYEVLERALNKQMIAFSQYYWGHWDRSVFSLYSEQHDVLIKLLRERNLERCVEELKLDIISFMQK